jgi:ribonuclease HII
MLKEIIGVDEAGRGPWAGPVVACAVILAQPIEGLTDSKKLSEKKRLFLAEEIRQQAIDFSFGEASPEEIDTLNIHEATLVAMRRAIEGITKNAQQVLIDGMHAPKNLSLPAKTIISGDLLHPSISAASILAKVKRDAMMLEFHERYPNYGFTQHKGYGTKQHQEALSFYGPCPIHRLSFRPVQIAQARKKILLP